MDFHRPDMKLGDNDVVHNGQQLIDQKLSADVTEARKMNFNAVLLSNFKNRFALVVAIAMTVITASCFVGAILYGNFISSAINICIGSIALVDCFGIWKLFAYDKEITPEGLKSFQRYASVQKVLNVVSMILFGLLAGIMIVISIALMIAFEQFSGNISEVVHSVGTLLDYQIPMDSEAISSFFIVGPTIIFITALIVIIFVTVYYTLINRALKNVIKYVDRLAACANGDVNYAIDQKPPFISLLVFSGVNALLTLLIPTDIGLWSIVYNLALCVYFVFIALLFKNIHKQINASAIDRIDVPADNQVVAPADNQVAVTADNQVAAPADNQVAAPADKQVGVSADKQTDAPAVKKITVQVIKKPIRTKLSIRKSRLVGNAMHKFIAFCDLENLKKSGGKAELIRLVDEGKLSRKDVTYISVDWINNFCKSGVFKDMLEAKRAEEKRLAKILEKISQKNALVKLGLPECIKDVNLGDLFNEIHARKVIADLRKNLRILLAYKLNKQRRRYDLPKEILTPEAIEMIYNSKLFKDIREAKRLYQEHIILIPKAVSGKKSCSLLIPDCIIEEWPNRIKVVDFKTGKQSEKRFVKKHTRQLSKYKNAIKHEFGNTPKSTEIYSFHLDKTIKIRIPD